MASARKIAAYQTAKFGLTGFSAALRAEYSRDGLDVIALCPGFVRTPLNERAALGQADKPVPEIPTWMTSAPETVAAKAVTAIRRNKGGVVLTPAARAYW